MTIEAVLVLVTALSAQQAPGPPTEPAHKVYVLSGCLEGASAESPFRLTGATTVGQVPPPRGATAPSKPAKPDVYLLQPVSGVGEQGISRERLQTHVGARVEVTLRPVDPLPGTPASAPKDKPEEPAPQRYTVIKIDRRADSCG
jgi:hypothetical protein